MILRKIASVCMLILLLISFCPFAMPIVEVGASSTFIVIDGTPDYAAIENPYYTCNLTSLGAISRFYIKPHTDFNIVSHTTGFRALGGHEENNWYNATYLKSAGQWVGYSVESCTHSIVKQTSDYVTVKTVVDFGGYSEKTETWYLENCHGYALCDFRREPKERAERNERANREIFLSQIEILMRYDGEKK